MRYLIALLLLLAPGAALGADINPRETPGVTSDGEVLNDLDLTDTYNIKNVPVIYQEAQTTDAAAATIAIQGGDPLPSATVNTSGGDVPLCGGIGVRTIPVIQATAAGSTLTFVVTDETGAVTSTTITLVAAAPGANEVQCITSDAVCALLEYQDDPHNIPAGDDLFCFSLYQRNRDQEF